jgi:hypothetical protein
VAIKKGNLWALDYFGIWINLLTAEEKNKIFLFASDH